MSVTTWELCAFVLSGSGLTNADSSQSLLALFLFFSPSHSLSHLLHSFVGVWVAILSRFTISVQIPHSSFVCTFYEMA